MYLYLFVCASRALFTYAYLILIPLFPTTTIPYHHIPTHPLTHTHTYTRTPPPPPAVAKATDPGAKAAGKLVPAFVAIDPTSQVPKRTHTHKTYPLPPFP